MLFGSLLFLSCKVLFGVLCSERNPRRPPMAYLIDEGAEPLTFTNIFPSWEMRLTRGVQVSEDIVIICMSECLHDLD